MLDLLVSQTGKPPFDPRAAVRKFAEHLAGYGLNRVTGDAYAGQTFRADFEAAGIAYSVAPARTTISVADADKLLAWANGYHDRGVLIRYEFTKTRTLPMAETLFPIVAALIEAGK